MKTNKWEKELEELLKDWIPEGNMGWISANGKLVETTLVNKALSDIKHFISKEREILKKEIMDLYVELLETNEVCPICGQDKPKEL